ncbi:hypothetical protein SCLCIDRAFT_1214667 [Scleroderma citrinum Foug A]|uniref:Uncharacterized protein n=1 Tax=Scleroderma citrinum Foug A TaxID=1036808 RepID=A0A0C3E4A6_9AGAM|nr:hypothetical protein SCLCIDRAFT_1214667 [Scleroderma citrinum Foug A]
MPPSRIDSGDSLDGGPVGPYWSDDHVSSFPYVANTIPQLQPGWPRGLLRYSHVILPVAYCALVPVFQTAWRHRSHEILIKIDRSPSYPSFPDRQNIVKKDLVVSTTVVFFRPTSHKPQTLWGRALVVERDSIILQHMVSSWHLIGNCHTKEEP